MTTPRISVIVPTYNCTKDLAECLEYLGNSDTHDHEVIVVDDASTDDGATLNLAREWGAHVIALEENGGPARARNIGAERARGEILMFIDSDVGIKPDTLTKVNAAFEENPDIDGLFGSYDDAPSANNVLSQYRNLLHHFVHQTGRDEATTFWSGCGAIRRSVFLEIGGFTTSYGRPCIEDIELGARLHKAGHKILLRKEIQVTHFKKWTLWSILKTDIWDRGVPWTELMLRDSGMPNDLNVKLSQRIGVVFAFLLWALFIFGAFYVYALWLLPILAVGGLLVIDSWSSTKRIPNGARVVAVLGTLGIAALMWFAGNTLAGSIAPYARIWFVAIALLTLGVVLVNFRFYAFLARSRYPLFAFFVLPLQMLYYTYSGIAFIFGVWFHIKKTKLPRATGGRPKEDASAPPN